jgi:cytochrome c oxidase subunit 2
MRQRGLLGLALAAAVASAAPPPGPSVEVRASKAGFEPSQITLRRGETTRLVLSSADTEHCFAIDVLRVEKRIVPGRSTRLDLTPERAGVFPFYCCLESGEAAQAERGQLTVSE